MAKRRKPRSGTVVIERAVLRSEAYRSLSRTAMVVYMDFLMKRWMDRLNSPRQKRDARWTVVNNGQIRYTYDEAEAKGIARSSFQRAIDLLVERGFIDIASAGGGSAKAATLYAVSERWQKWGTSEFVKKPRPRKTRWANSDRIGFQKGNDHHVKGRDARWNAKKREA